MAKKRSSSSESGDIEDSILKQWGDIITDVAYLSERRNKIINTTPQLDVSLGGGVPEGSFMLIGGPPGLGKSSLSLKVAANAQKIDSDYGRRDIYYFDIEGRLKIRDVQIKDLDLSPERFKIITSKPGHILYGEDFIDIGEKLIHNRPGSVFIFDSFSALCCRERTEGDIGDRVRDSAPLLLSNFCKRIAQVIPVNKSIVIGITHIIANQGTGHKTWSEAGGNKVKYQADIKMRGTHFERWEVGETLVGQKIHWEIEKTALTMPPSKTISYLRYGEGFDEFKEIIDLAEGCNIVKKKGAWYSFSDAELSDKQYQGIENVRLALIENPDLYAKIKAEVFKIYKF